MYHVLYIVSAEQIVVVLIVVCSGVVDVVLCGAHFCTHSQRSLSLLLSFCLSSVFVAVCAHCCCCLRAGDGQEYTFAFRSDRHANTK